MTTTKRKEYLKTYQREWMRKRRAAYFDKKSCSRCSSKERLELDHINPAIKVNHVIWSWAKPRREAELSKCQVLCRPCHWLKTREDFGWFLKHGTETGYNNYHCRCAPCRAAHARKIANYRRRFGRR